MLAGRCHLVRDQMVEFPDIELAPPEQILGIPLPAGGMDDCLIVRDSGADRPAYSEAALVEG